MTHPRLFWKTCVLALLFAAVNAATPLAAVASDLYKVNEAKPIYSTPKPAPGKAVIYFARPQSLGYAVKVKLYADGKFLGLIMSETFIAYECEPGKHEFIAAAENAGFLEAEVLADRIYLVQVAIHMGAWKARTHFETARPGTDAMKEITEKTADLHPIETTPEGVKWAEERQEKFRKTIKKFRDKGEEFEYLKPEDGAAEPPWIKH